MGAGAGADPVVAEPAVAEPASVATRERSRVARGGIGARSFLNFITQVLQNGAVAGKVLWIACRPMADHAGPRPSAKSSFPAAEMMIE